VGAGPLPLAHSSSWATGGALRRLVIATLVLVFNTEQGQQTVEQRIRVR
jgi:hypothetical protein